MEVLRRNRLLAFILAAALLTGCISAAGGRTHRYQATFLDLFDTVTTVIGYAESRDAFYKTANRLHDALLEYHRLYDIYHSYDGINNLKTVNDAAGGEALPVDQRIIDLLLFCRQLCSASRGKVDITAGSILALWHDARTKGILDPEHAALPSPTELIQTSEHIGFALLEIDQVNATVRLLDPLARLDVGAVAKGYAAEQVCRTLPPGLLVSVGGNVCATGPCPENNSFWQVGIQNPDGAPSESLLSVALHSGAVVTSGDYQRCYTVDGVRYHHIIDPDTLFPGVLWRSVTVLCSDSGIADGLSTALFLLPRAEGESLLAQYDAQAMWIAPDGAKFYSSGFRNAIIR